MTVVDQDEGGAGSAFGLASPGPVSAREVVKEMVAAGLLDSVMDKVATGQLALDGPGGFFPEMLKATLERGCQRRLKSDPVASRGFEGSSQHPGR